METQGNYLRCMLEVGGKKRLIDASRFFSNNSGNSENFRIDSELRF